MLTKIIQFILVSIPVFIFGALLFLDLDLDGERVINYDIGASSPYVHSILPKDRISEIQKENGKKFITIKKDPVYFVVDIPRGEYTNVDVQIEYRNNGQNIFELGGLVDIFSDSFDLRPIQNLFLDNLEWKKLEGDGYTLWSRNGDFNRLNDFFEKNIPRNKIATYNYGIKTPYRIDDYQPSQIEQKIDVSFRGYHKYITYLKNEPFNLRVDFTDMNRTAGKDDVVIRVWNWRQELVYEKKIKDDGNDTENQIITRGSISLNRSGWEEGVYSVELSGTSDIFWRTISTKQKYVTFVNGVKLGDEVGILAEPKSVELITDSKRLFARTLHANSIQTLTAGEKEVEINKTHEKFYFDNPTGEIVNIFSPLGDIEIVGDGKFAFSRSAFFNPDTVKINTYIKIEDLDVDYVLADYQVSSQDGEWMNSGASFNLNDLAVRNGSVKFVLSAPNIERSGAKVDISKISLKFTKPKMTLADFVRKIKNRIKSI